MTATRKTSSKKRPLQWLALCWHGGLALSLLPAPSFAITEAQFIEKVLAQDKLLEEAQIGLDIKQIERDASRDNYANWKVNLTASLSGRRRKIDRRVEYYENGASGATRPYVKESHGYPRRIGLNFEKRFLTSPLSMAAGVSYGRDHIFEDRYKRCRLYGTTNTDADDPCPFKGGTYYSPPYFSETGIHVSYLTKKERTTRSYVSVKYPLLKPDSNAENLKTHHRDIVDFKRQQLSFYETKEDFLDDRLNDYLAWFRYQKRMRINQELLDELRRLRPRDAAETALLKSAVYEIEQYDSDARIQSQAIREKLSVLLDDRTILAATPSFDLRQRAELVTENLPDYLRFRNRDLQKIAMDMELNQIEIDYYRKRNLPALDFTARAEKNFSNRNTTATNFYDDDEVIYSAGFEFRYPLGGSITVRAELDKRRLGVRKLEISYQDKLQDLLADIQLLNTLLTLDENRLLGAIAAAAQSTRIEHENYRAGRSSFRDLLQAYKDERGAKLQHIDDVVDYQINRIEYDNLLDRMIVTP